MIQHNGSTPISNGLIQHKKTDDSYDQWHNTYCPYCGVGCGLKVGVKNGQVAKVIGDSEHPSSLGDVCLKPINLPGTLDTPDRIHEPLVRMPDLDNAFKPVAWDIATEYIAEALTEIVNKHGPDSVAFYGSGQFTTEDYYVANKLLKGYIGTNNFDANSRLCMASAVVGYVKALGADGPPPAYEDIDSADCFFLIGTNTADCHPVLFNRIKRRKKAGGAKVIVVDPRKTRTAAIADLFLPIRPGTDTMLLNGMLNILYNQGKIDETFIAHHTNGFDAALRTARQISPHRVAAICGIQEKDLHEAAQLFGNAKAVLSFWSMGLNQSVNGVAKNQGVINLHLATGQIGKPGCGPFSLTGQPNAMGGREVGGLAHLLPGYRLVNNPEHRRDVESFWGIPEGKIAATSGLAAVEMFEAAAKGEIKAMWIMCTNPMVSMPNLDVVEKALQNLELLIVTDAYHPTDTTQYAHILLPAAQWSEREGVMTNSERRITYLPRMVDPVGQAKPDWRILADVAQAMGFGGFAYEDASEVFAEFVQLTQNRLCDYSGVSYERLQNEGPLQWPLPTDTHVGTSRLYTGIHGAAEANTEEEAATGQRVGAYLQTSDGKANFHAAVYEPPAEVSDHDFPLMLTTGRLRNHWHTMTRTGKSASLLKGNSVPFLEIHPIDAMRREIDTGDVVEIQSRRGVAWATAHVTNKIRKGTCFMPFHWGRLDGAFKAANNVTIEAVDPVSKEPDLKACAVEVRLRPGYKVIRSSKIFKQLVETIKG